MTRAGPKTMPWWETAVIVLAIFLVGLPTVAIWKLLHGHDMPWARAISGCLTALALIVAIGAGVRFKVRRAAKRDHGRDE